MRPLVAPAPASHKHGVPILFDMELRGMRRDRAARRGPELFLLQRTFDDCLDRLRLVQRRFRHALLLGCPEPRWRDGLSALAERVDVRDPGRIFAAAAGGDPIVEDAESLPAGAYDVILTIGTLDTVNDLPAALRSLRGALAADGFFMGAISGGDTLPQLRKAMHAADQRSGGASPRVHPRIEPAAVAPLLDMAGFILPVVDVDRVPVSYPSLGRLVADLRAMAATNLLVGRSRRPLSRAAVAAASASFAVAGDGTRTTETFEILHFAAWTPPAPAPDQRT